MHVACENDLRAEICASFWFPLLFISSFVYSIARLCASPTSCSFPTNGRFLAIWKFDTWSTNLIHLIAKSGNVLSIKGEWCKKLIIHYDVFDCVAGRDNAFPLDTELSYG